MIMIAIIYEFISNTVKNILVSVADCTLSYLEVYENNKAVITPMPSTATMTHCNVVFVITYRIKY